MTDSMKFGPEWLRNMSADSTVSNSIYASGQMTNSASLSTSGGGGGIMAPSNGNSNSSLTSSNANINHSRLHNNANMSNTGGSRNTLPEFRYGREEMLLLFDRSCNIPEILPTYKNLFVDVVQFPLALVPSTDEEVVLQGTAPQTQRPAWLQRSPVGFSTSTRGGGRGGTMERGRMRGKSVYHPVFQRPSSMFEEDQRSATLKSTDRSWSERNGGGGISVISGGPSTVSGLGSDAWQTPASSPRREFSSHSKNMENWRRSRIEDESGDTSTATTTTFTTDGGWRMNSSGFQNPHTRWSRSTSWRDDDLVNNENPVLGTSSGGAQFAAGTPMIQRSCSTISTSHGERGGHQSISKQTTGYPMGGGGGTTRNLSATTSGTRQAACGNMWPNNVQTSTVGKSEGANDDLNLPEWAMENPSDIGGTFDASGAFHGAVDDDGDHLLPPEKLHQDDSESKGRREELEAEIHEISSKTSEDHSKKSSNEIFKNTLLSEKENFISSSSPSPAPSSTITLQPENTDSSAECENSQQDERSGLKESVASGTMPEKVSHNVSNHPEYNVFNKDVSAISSAQKYSDYVVGNNSASGDYGERMMKVTDDMIEKLIMDDEETKEDQMKLSAQRIFVNALQQQNHQLVAPAISGPAGPPNSMPDLYNMAGMIVDHSHNMTALHQLQQQHMAAATAVAIGLQPPPPTHPLTSTAPTELWFYRDPQAKVQGPFSAIEMTEWYRAGYFNENLFVRRVCDTRCRPLGELIKICNGQMPFNNSHLIPIDLNPSQLTPPLPPNISSVQPISQTNDFVMKTLSEHQQQHQQHEELKGNVTAAADSLGNALKSLINSVDMSHVLNMHFQTLQERFIRNQEMEIVNELSKNESFQRLTAVEQESIVRQKLQMMVLPEYLTNLTGLSNSLAALNSTAQTQLYDTIAECSKKEQLFNNTNQQHHQQLTQFQPHRPSHNTSSSATYGNTDDFMIKPSKSANQDLGITNDLLNELNLRRYINNGSDASGAVGGGGVTTPNSHANHEYLNEQQLFSASGATPNPPTNNSSQSPMMQMWMTQITANQSNNQHQQVQPPHQQSLASQQQHGVNNQWLNGPLVGIPAIGGGGIIGSPKPMPTSMWDVATLEQHVQVQQQLEKQQLVQQHIEHNCRRLKETKENPQQQEHEQKLQPPQDINKQNSKQNTQQQQKLNESQKQIVVKVFSNDINKEEQQRHLSQNQKNNNNNKRSSNNNTAKQTTKPTTKDEIVVVVANTTNNSSISKKSEDDRRREINEEKRRLKEERKRQQMEEDKRRHIQIEEEKHRQLQEEEKRQQQIQSQRRKALMSANNSSTHDNNNSANVLLPSNASSNSSVIVVGGNKSNSKEQQRIQSSVAPWSTQTFSVTNSPGPGLAEIQKAERRERRADQQRQLEIQEKQMRALAAAAEVQDPVLKWNAAPVQVKSFAEIQAEEAKRLAHEQVELQRRKELESNTNLVNINSGVATTPVIGLTSTSNMSSIWSGTKIWGATGSNTGFWEEPHKYNSGAALSSPSSNNISNNNNVTAATIVAQQPSPSNKNVKKSQSVAVMQNNICIVTSSSGAAGRSSTSNQMKGSNTTATTTTAINKPSNQNKPHDNNLSADYMKPGLKNNINNVCDDYEAEFINWCTKSLNNMNAKVDVPTFVSFLRDLESPYEVKDYIRMYLGESKEYIDFAKQFLERRSKYKNLQRAQNAHNDDLCKPAQAITPSANDNENKSKQKKIKKNKMTKLDARILGFSVTAAEGRINVGDRDYVDAP